MGRSPSSLCSLDIAIILFPQFHIVLKVFNSNLKSPIVEITVGKGPSQTLLRAHQALLCQSPYFAGVCALFQEDEVMRVELPEDDMDAIGCFLQYIYTGEYFPRKLLEARALEHDPNAPAADDTGEQLLKHARIYTLAEKLGMPVSFLATLITERESKRDWLDSQNSCALQDPPHQLDRQRGDQIRPLRLRQHATRRRYHPQAHCRVLGSS